MNSTRHLETHLVYPKLATERHFSGMERRIRSGHRYLLLATALGIALVLWQGYLQSKMRDTASHAANLAQISQVIAVQAVQLRDAHQPAREPAPPETDPSGAGAVPAASPEEARVREELRKSTRRFESELATYKELGGVVGEVGAPGSGNDSLASRHRAILDAAFVALRADSRSGVEASLPLLFRGSEAFRAQIETHRAEIDAAAAGQGLFLSLAIGVLILAEAVFAIRIWMVSIRPTIARMRDTIAAMAERVQHDDIGQRQVLSFLERFSTRLHKRLNQPTMEGAFGPHRQSLNDTMSLMNLQERLMQLRVDANELKSFVELGIHHSALEPVPMRWNEMVRGAVERTRAEAEQRSVEIIEHYDPLCAAELLGDERKLRHVLTSAINRSLNALEVGEIRVRTQRVQSTPAHEWVRWELTAVGSSDPDEANNWIFQYGGVTAPSQPGACQSEAGASVCGQIARLLGADVEVQPLGEEGWKIALEVKLPVRSAAILDKDATLEKSAAVQNA